MIKAIIFDMDGTLIDTEKYYRIFWVKAFEAFGLTLTDEQSLSLRSLGRPFSAKQFKDWFGEKADYNSIRAKRRELMEPFLEEVGIERKAGALELLQRLKEKNVTTAIATASDLERAHKYLSETGLEEYFDKMISSTQVKAGKPAPDTYLYACQELGLDPSECIAVEDSPNGVMSAYRAGCKVVMVPDQTQPDEELCQYLSATIPILTDLEELIETL